MGIIVRERREKLGLSQQQLAAKAGTTQATVSRIESGDVTNSSFATIFNLATALQIDPSILLTAALIQPTMVLAQ